MKAIDFFCGAGGLTRGLLDAGIKVVAGIDIDEQCKETYEQNNPGAKFIGADIRDFQIEDIQLAAKACRLDEMLFSACAPCQPFSQQRKTAPSKRDARLLLEFGRIVRDARPAFVLVENVTGLAKVKGYSSFKRFLNILDSCDYNFTHEVLDAKSFGVPQNRRRLVLLASREKRISLPKPRFGSPSRPYRTVADAISHFPSLEAGEIHPNVKNHEAAFLDPINLERLANTPHNGGDRREWPKHLWLECHKGKYQGHTDVYGRMFWDQPAPALTSKCNSISNGRYGHPEQDRAITLREAAALQSFPDGYEFFGSNLHIARQIGNAVPVLLAEALGKQIRFTAS